jgi:hypothetical protein
MFSNNNNNNILQFNIALNNEAIVPESCVQIFGMAMGLHLYYVCIELKHIVFRSQCASVSYIHHSNLQETHLPPSLNPRGR